MKFIRKLLAATAAAVVITVGVIAPAHATIKPIDTKPGYVTAVWYAEGTAQWPAGGQTLLTSKKHADAVLDVAFGEAQAATLGCGYTIQLDVYNDDKTTTSLLKGGKLYGPSNPTESWPGGGYKSEFSKVFYTGDCAPGEANGAASIAASCGAANLTVTNALDGKKERLTASFVVFVDGQFFEALTAQGGQTVTGTPITFAEDSGSHTVQVRSGSAQGDKLLAEATVLSDCVLPGDERETRTSTDVSCETGAFTSTEQFRTRSYSYVDGVATAGPWSDWAATGEPTVRPATVEELEVEGCVIIPPKPEDLVSQTVKSVIDCKAKTRTITTIVTTTGSAYDPETNTWPRLAPVDVTTVQVVTINPDKLAACSAVKVPPTKWTPPAKMATTGADFGSMPGAVGALLALGAAIMFGPRIRRYFA